jgi:hypothetical protein
MSICDNIAVQKPCSRLSFLDKLIRLRLALKRCLKVGVDSGTPGGFVFVLVCQRCVTHKHLWKLSHLSQGEVGN